MFRPCPHQPLFALAAVALTATAATAQTTYTEAEPNSQKSVANPVTLASGDSITGSTTGTTTSATSTLLTTADYWRIKTAAAPLAIYRHSTVLSTTGTDSFTPTLRGLSQTVTGTINTGTDVAIATGLITPRTLAWYGFGRQEEIYYGVTGTTATTAAYKVTLTDTVVTPVVMSGTLYSGNVTVRVVQPTVTLSKMDCWIYDSTLHPLMHDVPAGSGPAGSQKVLVTAGNPANTMASFIRTLPAGTYYLAVSGSNIANNLPSYTGSQGTDTSGQIVMDFPDCLTSSGNTATVESHAYVELADASGHTLDSTDLAYVPPWYDLVYWVQFTVVDPTGECCIGGSCTVTIQAACSGAWTIGGSGCMPGPCAAPTGTCCVLGACTISAESTCTASNGTWDSLGTTCGTDTCPVQCCNFGACTFVTQSACTGGGGTFTVGGAACTPTNPCPQPTGICCNNTTGACAVIFSGSCATGNTLGSGTACSAGTPSDSCPVLKICCNNTDGSCVVMYSSIASCATGTTTGSGTTCSAGTPSSSCPTLKICCNTTDGSCVVMYSSIASCATGTSTGTGTVCSSGTPSGSCPALKICCNSTDGSCVVRYSSGAACATGSATGSGTVCASNVPSDSCPVLKVCCNTADGTCVLSYSIAACTGSYVQGTGTTCSGICPSTTCCNTTTGACTVLYSGSCGTGTTPNAASTCSTNPCPTVVCCNTTTFACALVATSGDCTGVVGTGSTCSPTNPCLNDTCATATPIIVGSSTLGDNTNATTDADPLGAGVSCNTLSSYTHAVWYTFTETSPTSRRLAVNTCSVVTAFDAQLYVLSGSACSGLACVNASATSAFGCETQQPSRNPGNDVQTDTPNSVFCTVPGTTYYIIVATQSGSSGVFQLNLVDTGEPGCDGVTPPVNDTCSGARVIPSMPYSQLAFPATATDDDDVSCNDGLGAVATHGMWWTFTTGADSGHLTFKRLPYYTAGTNGVLDITGYAASTCGTGMPEAFCATVMSSADVAVLNPMTQYYFLVSYYKSGITSFPSGKYFFTFAADTGACCDAAACSVLANSACTGYWLGANTVCSTVCADVGACCNGAACTTVANAAACTGIFMGAGSSCSPTSPCVTGVCCRGATCTTAYTSAAACGAATTTSSAGGPGWAFVSSSSVCNAGVNSDGTYSGALTSTTSPCCFANYNHSANGLEVQDIFDFLNDWFAGRPIAIPGGDGTSTTGLAVQNIFNFLNAWFAGGCI